MQKSNAQSPYLQSLSQTKHKYYQLCKEIRGIESRVFHLENENAQNLKRLEVIQKKNSSLERLKKEKNEREYLLKQAHKANEIDLAEKRDKTEALRKNHSKLLNSIWSALQEEKRMSYSQIKAEKARNEKKIQRVHEKFAQQKRINHDKIQEAEREAQKKIKDYHVQKSVHYKEQQEKENMKLTHSIDGLERRAKWLEQHEGKLIESLKATGMASSEASSQYLHLTKGSSPQRYEKNGNYVAPLQLDSSNR